ncbi:MAG TPA: iron chelate uptake ABC transporter family permease subunit [Abditibacteriaceae bacterium]
MQISSSVWIILIGALVACSCALVGSFLVLRRMAMLGDAISHAVLPGIAIAFLLTQSRSSLPMLIGATALGILTAFIVQLLNKGGRVQGDAAIGVTFTALFAIGVVLISLYADKVDLDQECVLYGEIAYAPFDVLKVNGVSWGPRAFWQMFGIFAICTATILTLFKELKVSAFDPEMATALGINVAVMHYILMALVSITTVGAFELVGAILVVAMLIVPAATAYLLTDDLRKMLFLSMLCGILSSTGGYLAAQRFDASIAGAITVVAGILFTLAILFSPSHGVVARWLSQRSLSRQIGEEDALQMLWRQGELAAASPGVLASLDTNTFATLAHYEKGTARTALQGLKRDGLARSEAGQFELTDNGRSAAQQLVHRHRVYETFLGDLGYPSDHVHPAADRTEHFISPQLVTELDNAAGNPQSDPHGKPIPHD